MLTQNDLKAIGRVIDDKISPLETKMGSFENKMDSLENKVNSFENKMDSFENKLGVLDKKMNRGFKSVNTKLNTIISYFDHQDIDIKRRLNRIETHLSLAPLNS